MARRTGTERAKGCPEEEGETATVGLALMEGRATERAEEGAKAEEGKEADRNVSSAKTRRSSKD